MHKRLAEFYRAARSFHEEAIKALIEVENYTKQLADEREAADVAYALREVSAYADEIRKRCNATQELAEKLACALTIVITQSSETIHTAHCSATPHVRNIVSIPSRSKDPEAYGALMRFLKIPDDLWAKDSEHAAVKPHWPGLVELLGELQAQGKPMPPGIDPNKTYPEYSLTIRAKQSPAGGSVETKETPF